MSLLFISKALLHSQSYIHKWKLLGTTKLLSVGQQHHWSSRGLGALFKDTWMVENTGLSTTHILHHQDLSCLSLRRSIVSVWECITSDFCCFSISGMEMIR